MAPAHWPPAPAEMSFSTLHQIETCPRQWSLMHAGYADLDTKLGYPECSSFAALRGRVVHKALSVIAGQLVAAGCAGMGDSQAPAVLRTLGGFTAVIDRTIDDILAAQAGNFRMCAQESSLRLKFVREIPAIREQLQLLLSRLPLNLTIGRKSPSTKRLRTGSAGRELGNGIYHELVLRSRRLGWKGVADLLEVTDTHVQITEFKTSEYSDHHKAQLYTYAVLWRCDESLNPTRRIADRLVLSYPNENLSIPHLSAGDLSRYEMELAKRTQSARLECAQIPPRAKPDPNVCARCQFRHLCGDYWTTPTLKNKGNIALAPSLDCEILTIAPRGPWTWSVRVLGTPGRPASDLPQEGILSVRGHDHIASAQISAGARYRVLNCRLGATDESTENLGLPLELNQHSEVFRI